MPYDALIFPGILRGIEFLKPREDESFRTHLKFDVTISPCFKVTGK